MTVCVAGQMFFCFTIIAGMVVNFDLFTQLNMVGYLCSCTVVRQVQHGIADRRQHHGQRHRNYDNKMKN